MEKYLILFFFISNQIFCQKIKVIDENDEPIYNVGFFKIDQTFAEFSNFQGEVDLSSFDDEDSIIVQHPTFENLSITKSYIKNNRLTLKSKIINIDEIVFSVNRWKENIKELTNKTLIISEEKIEKISPQTSADLLEKTGEIYVQKSQLGGGSPMIRGFSANRILLTLDGVRLNNIIYRSGNIHNIISIEPNLLEGIEVIYGPASVIYGSDALGGAINFKTKDPTFNYSKTKLYSSQKIQYNSSSNSKHYSLKFGVSSRNIGMISSLSFNSFDDLRSGYKRNKNFRNFGFREEYVVRNSITNKDEIIPNDNFQIQKFSGYSQINFINKLNFRLSDNINVIHGIYFSKSSNIPRYDRLVLYEDIFTPKYGEWFYGPNKFLMNRIQINSYQKTKLFDAFKLNLSHQNLEESRHTRLFNSNSINNRNEGINVFAFNFDFDKKNKNDEFFYGLETIINDVKSSAYKEDLITNSRENISTRYPDGKNNFISNSIYVSYKRNIKKVFTNVGLRGNNSILKSSISNTFFDFPFNEIETKSSSISGNIGIRYNLEKSSFKFQYSNGYRSPNLDDVGKVFDSEPGNIIIPNPDLKSEYVNNFEINYEYNSEKIFLKNTFFYIRLNNAIIRDEGTLNENDSIIYDGILSNVQQLINGGRAYVYGFSNNILFKISNSLNIENSISYSYSKDLISDRPLRHTPPVFGKFSISYSKKKYQVGYFINYNGRKSIKNFSVSELNKLYLYPETGSPNWITHNLYFKLNYNYFLNFDFGIDNIFDIHYRTYSSGISAPGRNIRLGFNLKF